PEIEEAARRMNKKLEEERRKKLDKFFRERMKKYKNQKPIFAKWFKPLEDERRRELELEQQRMNEFIAQKIREVDLSLTKTFGIPLEEVLQRKHEKGEIPIIVDKMLTFLENKAKNLDIAKEMF